jgi:hypothetical protein
MKKHKTFVADGNDNLDKAVNEWAATQKNLKIESSTVTAGAFTAEGTNAVTGKKVTKKVPVLTMSVWYSSES